MKIEKALDLVQGRVATKWFFCDVGKYKIGRNKILTILPKFREKLFESCEISSCY